MSKRKLVNEELNRRFVERNKQHVHNMITHNLIPVKRHVVLDKQNYDAKGLRNFVKSGGSFVPHSRRPLTGAELREIENKGGLDERLIQAVSDGNVGEVRELLRRGADPNFQTNPYGSALILAALKGHTDVVKELMSHEITDPNLQNNELEFTALMIAATQGHTDVVKELMSHQKTDPNLQGTFKTTALMMAALKGHTDVVKELMSHEKTDPNLQDDSKATALMMAAREGHTDVVKELLSHERTNRDVRDRDGKTALDRASNC